MPQHPGAGPQHAHIESIGRCLRVLMSILSLAWGSILVVLIIVYIQQHLKKATAHSSHCKLKNQNRNQITSLPATSG